MSKTLCSPAVNTKRGTTVLRQFPHLFLVLMVMLGRFLLGLLTDLLKWHQDEQQYLQDNRVKGVGNGRPLTVLDSNCAGRMSRLSRLAI